MAAMGVNRNTNYLTSKVIRLQMYRAKYKLKYKLNVSFKNKIVQAILRFVTNHHLSCNHHISDMTQLSQTTDRHITKSIYQTTYPYH